MSSLSRQFIFRTPGIRKWLSTGPGRGLARALLLGFIFLPLACYFAPVLLNPAAVLGGVLTSRAEAARLGWILARTILLAALAATLALAGALAVLGAALALPPRIRRPLLAVAALPFFIPSTVAAIAWIQALGNAGWVTHALQAAGVPAAFLPAALYSVPGCALALALHDFPIVLALGWLGWRGAGRAALEAGATLLPPGRLWGALAWGWLRPWLAAGWLLVFMRALHEYSVPLLLRCHVFSVEIVSVFNISYEPARAMALALPLVALSLAGVALLARILRRVRWPADPGRPAALPPLAGPARWAVLGAGGLFFALPALLAPLGTLALMAGGWRSYQSILLSAREQIRTSLGSSALAAAGAVLLAAFIADCGLRIADCQKQISNIKYQISNSPLNPQSAIRNPQFLLFGLIGLPGSVVGMAEIAFWNRPGWGGVPAAFFDSGLALALGLLLMALPAAWLILRGRLRETPRVLLEVQRLQPAGWWRGWWRLTVPRLAGPALVAGGLGFILSMQEAQASLLLAAPGQETMSIRAMTLLHNAPDALVAAFCLIMVALMAAGLGALWGVGWAVGKMAGW